MESHGGARKKRGSQKPWAALRQEIHAAQEILEACGVRSIPWLLKRRSRAGPKVGYLIALGVSFLWNLAHAPVALDEQRRNEICTLQSLVDEKTRLSQEAVELLIAGAESENFRAIRAHDQGQRAFT